MPYKSCTYAIVPIWNPKLTPKSGIGVSYSVLIAKIAYDNFGVYLKVSRRVSLKIVVFVGHRRLAATSVVGHQCLVFSYLIMLVPLSWLVSEMIRHQVGSP